MQSKTQIEKCKNIKIREISYKNSQQIQMYALILFFHLDQSMDFCSLGIWSKYFFVPLDMKKWVGMLYVYIAVWGKNSRTDIKAEYKILASKEQDF